MITYIIFRFMNDIRYFGKEKVFTIQDVSMTIQDLDEKTLTNSAILKLSRLQQDKN
mgnify:CR=1 FL=1